jgi:hypothetical protein
MMKRKLSGFCNKRKFKEKNWHLHNRNAHCWSFYCVNDNLKVNLDVPQLIRWHIESLSTYCFCEFKKAFKERFDNIL